MQTAMFKPNSCPYCGTAISPNEAIRPGHCPAQDCATRHAVKGYHDVKAARQKRLDEGLERARRAPELERLIAQAGALSMEDVVLVAVPYQNNPLVPVEPERMEAFKASLKTVIDAAFAASDEEVAGVLLERNSEPETPVMAAGCATCQGKCCHQGNARRAFIDRDTILGHRQLWPDLTAEIIYDNYIARLPELAAEHGCVYQGELGCTLAREMRASICNSFHCHEVEHAEARANEHEERPVAIVAIDDEGETRNFATLTTEAGWQRL